MANRNDLSKQIEALEISALPDDVSSMAPDSTTHGYRRHTTNIHAPPSTASRMSRASFMNFGQSGKKSPLGRAAINRMTHTLVGR